MGWAEKRCGFKRLRRGGVAKPSALLMTPPGQNGRKRHMVCKIGVAAALSFKKPFNGCKSRVPARHARRRAMVSVPTLWGKGVALGVALGLAATPFHYLAPRAHSATVKHRAPPRHQCAHYGTDITALLCQQRFIEQTMCRFDSRLQARRSHVDSCASGTCRDAARRTRKAAQAWVRDGVSAVFDCMANGDEGKGSLARTVRAPCAAHAPGKCAGIHAAGLR